MFFLPLFSLFSNFLLPRLNERRTSFIFSPICLFVFFVHLILLLFSAFPFLAHRSNPYICFLCFFHLKVCEMSSSLLNLTYSIYTCQIYLYLEKWYQLTVTTAIICITYCYGFTYKYVIASTVINSFPIYQTVTVRIPIFYL